jgi:hypothetical protein
MSKPSHTKATKVTEQEVIKRGLRRLSRKIAKELFTSCNGRQWPRMVFESGNGCIPGEGRSEKSTADVIERALRKAGGLR